MDDLIAEIDRLHARMSAEGICFLEAARRGTVFREAVEDNWPAIRDRLREAERRAKALDEELQSVLADWNAARAASGSRTNGGLVGHIGDLARRAKAFDAIASERIVIRHPFVDGRISEEWEAVPEWSSRDSRSPDLLTAIETALRGEENSQ